MCAPEAIFGQPSSWAGVGPSNVVLEPFACFRAEQLDCGHEARVPGCHNPGHERDVAAGRPGRGLRPLRRAVRGGPRGRAERRRACAAGLEGALDVGCGPGALPAGLAERLGADNVAAVEPSDVFAAACRSRVPGADVRVAGSESIPFEDDNFGRPARLAQLVVSFMDGRSAGPWAEMRRVTERGPAASAGCVWDYGGEMNATLRAFWDSGARARPRAGRRGDDQLAIRAAPDELGELWRGAGLSATSRCAAHGAKAVTTTSTNPLGAVPDRRRPGRRATRPGSARPAPRGAPLPKVPAPLAVPDGPFTFSPPAPGAQLGGMGGAPWESVRPDSAPRRPAGPGMTTAPPTTSPGEGSRRSFSRRRTGLGRRPGPRGGGRGPARPLRLPADRPPGDRAALRLGQTRPARGAARRSPVATATTAPSSARSGRA